MPRKPRKTKNIRPQLTRVEIAYLSGTLETLEIEPYSLDSWDEFSLDSDRKRLLWKQHGVEYLAKWIVAHPCTRPAGWWDWQAPRWDDPWDDCFFHGTFAEPRLRLGGVGIPKFEVLAYVPTFKKGIPSAWLSEQDLRIWPGIGKAIDRNDPPVFEAEANFLLRHDLLTPAELRFLEKHPEALDPEVVRIDDND